MREVIAKILALSRSGASLAAGELRIDGLIRYSRGRITLLNPEGFEVSSCECYRILSRTINPCSPEERLAPDRVNRSQSSGADKGLSAADSHMHGYTQNLIP
jgi:hypothetical protein